MSASLKPVDGLKSQQVILTSVRFPEQVAKFVKLLEIVGPDLDIVATVSDRGLTLEAGSYGISIGCTLLVAKRHGF